MRLKLSFQIKLFLCPVAFSCLLLTCIGAYTYYQLDAQLHRDLGARARAGAGNRPHSFSGGGSGKHDAARIAALMKKSAPAATPVISSSAIVMPATFIIPNTKAARHADDRRR